MQKAISQTPKGTFQTLQAGLESQPATFVIATWQSLGPTFGALAIG